jgi:hypothetical protein
MHKFGFCKNVGPLDAHALHIHIPLVYLNEQECKRDMTQDWVCSFFVQTSGVCMSVPSMQHTPESTPGATVAEHVKCAMEKVGAPAILQSISDATLDLVADYLQPVDLYHTGCLCAKHPQFAKMYERSRTWRMDTLDHMSQKTRVELNPSVRRLVEVTAVGGRVPVCLKRNHPYLRSLKFSETFQARLSRHALPGKLKRLDMGMRFNHPLIPGCLGEGLLELRLGGCFNQALDANVLPRTIEKLNLCDAFNQCIAIGVLPARLLILDTGDSFNQELLPGALPNMLKELKLGQSFNQRMHPGTFPASLETLSIGHGFRQVIEKLAFNEGLRSLDFATVIARPFPTDGTVLPSTLRRLRLTGNFSQQITTGMLPDGLEFLQLSDEFIHSLAPHGLPESLRILKFYCTFDSYIPRHGLSSNLQVLNVGHCFNQIFGMDVLPPTLQKLVLGDNYDQLFAEGVLPPSLRILKFGCRYDQPVGQGVLPEGLLYAEFGTHFNQPLRQGALPSTLEFLALGARFNQDLERGSLPLGLRALHLRSSPDGRKHPYRLGLKSKPQKVESYMLPALLRSESSQSAEALVLAVKRFLPPALTSIVFDRKHLMRNGYGDGFSRNLLDAQAMSYGFF